MGKRRRVRLHWAWEGAIKNWTIKFILKNKWRCDAIHDIDDLLQDAYLVFMKIKARYPQVTEERHFMALYKSALSNAICDRSRYMRRKNLIHLELHETAYDALTATMVGDTTNAGHLGVVLSSAPQELQQALTLISTEPEKLRVRLKGPRENLNMKLRRILGVSTEFDFTGSLRALLQCEERNA